MLEIRSAFLRAVQGSIATKRRSDGTFVVQIKTSFPNSARPKTAILHDGALVQTVDGPVPVPADIDLHFCVVSKYLPNLLRLEQLNGASWQKVKRVKRVDWEWGAESIGNRSVIDMDRTALIIAAGSWQLKNNEPMRRGDERKA